MATVRNGDYFGGTEYYVWPRWNLRTTGWSWTLSGSGTNEYYLSDGSGGVTHPDTGVSLTDPPMVEANSIDFTQGTVGSLSASQFDWGENDSLGYSTLYVRLADDADPDSKTDGFVKAGGDDSEPGTSEATAWQTVKHATESGITRNTSNGDRINLKSGATDTYSAVSDPEIDISLYATNATSMAPYFVQGYDSSPNDRGIGRMTPGTGSRLYDNTTFDYAVFQDVLIQAQNGSTDLLRLDRNTVLNHCAVINTGSAGAISIDGSGSVAIDSYFEGDHSSSVIGTGSGRAFNCMIVNRGNGGLVNSWWCFGCLGVVEGNIGTGDEFTTGHSYYTAYVCLGTPNATSVGHLGAAMENAINTYIENVATAFQLGTSVGRMVFSGNSYYNCTTPLTIPASADPFLVEDPIDTGSSIFVDSTQSTADACDFSIRAGSTPVNNILRNVGFSDPNYGIDHTFDTYVDSGLGLEDTGGVASFNPYQSRVFG